MNEKQTTSKKIIKGGAFGILGVMATFFTTNFAVPRVQEIFKKVEINSDKIIVLEVENKNLKENYENTVKRIDDNLTRMNERLDKIYGP